MINQSGKSLLSIAAPLVILTSFSAMTVEAVDQTDKIIAKAESAATKMAHAEVTEQFELNHQVFYIEKYTGEYDGDIANYLEDEGFVNDEGLVDMSKLLGKRKDRISTGKGTDGTDIYKIKTNDEKNVQIIYCDKDGAEQQIGELYNIT